MTTAIWRQDTLTLRDGTAVPVRPIRPADAAALQRLYGRLSDRSRYLRFFQALPELPERQAQRLAGVDNFDRFALVALDPGQPDEIVAVVRYARDPGTDRAEFAAVVEDRWQGRGLGRAMVRRLIDAARRRGIRAFYALILKGNARVRKLLADLGLPQRERDVDGEVVHVEFDLARSHPVRARLRAWWPGARVAKTALAIALAWWAGQAIGEPRPIFAALGALHAVQPTVAASLRKTGGQLLGIIIGTLLALATSLSLPALSPVAIGLAALLALAATVRPGVSALLGTEVAVTALFVLALGQGQPYWGLVRLWEVAVGGGVAIAINAFVLPPTYLDEAREAVHRLTRQLVEHTRLAVADLLTGPPEGQVRTHLLAARDAVGQAEQLAAQTTQAREAIRCSPLHRYGLLGRGTVEELERLAYGVETLAAAVVHARTALRAAWQASRRPARPQVVSLDWHVTLDALVQAIARFEAYLVWGTPDALQAARDALQHATAQHGDFLAKAAALPADAWDVDRAAALSELEHILDDLAVALGLKPSGATLARTS
jgi:uncharacterized membrane protein YgaE (UPF0421/DUF939 family)/RimJ/RimL family protein N-acetyltransferase